MSPEPYVRAHTFALAAALLVAAVLGSAIAALACTAAVALVAGVLYLRYRGDLLAAGVTTVPRHRERPDLIVAGDLRAALVAGAVAAAFMLVSGVERPDLGVAPATAVLLAVTAAGVLLSLVRDPAADERPARHPSLQGT